MARQLPTSDEFLSHTVKFLLEGDETDAANLLLSCEVAVGSDHEYECEGWYIQLTGPRRVVTVLENGSSADTLAVMSAIDTVVKSYGAYPVSTTVVFQREAIDPDWRTQVTAIIEGSDVNNQALSTTPQSVRIWNNLRFRSESEVRIAQALDNAGVLFLPNCKGRLSTPEGRRNKEADFLICYEGKWGILEVDGAPYHPPTRTVQDHQRDRLFRAYGIRVVEHFDASECFEKPAIVVQRFLEILRSA